MDPQASSSSDIGLTVKVSSDSPMIDCELSCKTYTRPSGAKGARVARPEPCIVFSWYREQIHCSVHSSSLATYQCLDCVALELPIKDSYHCSAKCFISEWERHKEQHRFAAEVIHSTSDGNYQVPEPLGRDEFLPDLYIASSDNGSAEVVEKDGKVWAKVGSSASYVPTIGDLGCKLRLECVATDCSTGSHLCTLDVILTDPVIQFPAPPPPRCMIKIKSPQQQSSNDATFTVLSYNILAELYAVYNQNCPAWARDWSYRRINLLREIIGYQADIICLQEVQSDHFENFFKPQLTKSGYSVMYKKRLREVYTANKNVIDGCAICYRKELFRDITKYEVEFLTTTKSVVDALESTQQTQGVKRLLKDNVALVLILEMVKRDSNHPPFRSRICVANTHICASTDTPDVKLCQVAQLVKGLEKIAESKIPLLICGDFNSLPKSLVIISESGKYSDPYKLMVREKIGLAERDSDPLGIYKHLRLWHSLPLASAYPAVFRSELESSRREQQRNINPETKEPVYTNHTQKFTGTLDYIFFTEDSLAVESVLEPLDEERIGGQYLPSPSWSSDHIALMANFRYKPPYFRGLAAPIPANPWLPACPRPANPWLPAAPIPAYPWMRQVTGQLNFRYIH